MPCQLHVEMIVYWHKLLVLPLPRIISTDATFLTDLVLLLCFLCTLYILAEKPSTSVEGFEIYSLE